MKIGRFFRKASFFLGFSLIASSSLAIESRSEPLIGEVLPDILFEDSDFNNFSAGSCYRTKLAEGKPIWKNIAAYDPDMWFWLGDSIYADWQSSKKKRKKWKTITDDPDYQKLRFVWGVYDDHDFAFNNVQGGLWPFSKRNQHDYQDYLKIDEDSYLRDRKGHYGLIRYKLKNGATVDFVYLDTRRKKRVFGGKKTMLGKEHWKWLTKYVETQKADLVFIASGVQVLPTGQSKETWSQVDKDRTKLLAYLKSLPGKVVILSGDRHFSELSRLDKLTEITVSGMTHLASTDQPANPFRVGDLIFEFNVGHFDISWSEDQGDLIPKVEVQFANPIDGNLIGDKITL